MYAYVVNYKDEVWIKLSYGVWTDLKKTKKLSFTNYTI